MVPGNTAGQWATTRDGRQLYLERAGAGAPTVVFEAGMGVSRNEWGAVVPVVSAHTATVVYDRSGLGRSAPDPQPRTLSRLAQDLTDLLDHVGPEPVILVAHSWGGPIIRSFAAQQPHRVAGLVLVDATDELCELFFARSTQLQERILTPLAVPMARLGLLKLTARRMAAALPEPAASAMRAEDGTVTATRTQLAESTHSIAELRRLRDHPLVTPAVPVTIISGTKASRAGRKRRDALLAAHRQRAEALPSARHVSAGQSGHLVPFTEPHLIADEVLRLVDLVRTTGG